MIKFNCLIHKTTGTVISYNDWIRGLESKRTFIITNSERMHILKAGEKSFYNYDAKEMLFSDDFEIIYDSEFTIEELDMLYSCVGVTINEYECNDCSCEEENDLLDKIEKVKNKYGIEV